MRVIDIAHEFGFGSEQAYIRAFRGAFGVAPGSLLRTRRIVAIRQPIDVGQLSPAGDGVRDAETGQ
jgi:AraC-like DNA-binding protein